MTLNNLKKRIITSLVLLSIIYLIFNFNFFLAYILIVIGVLSIIEFLQISKKIFTKSVVLFFFNLIFILYIFYFCMTFFLMVSHSGFKIIILMLLIICVASDMGGYIFGKIFKGPKLTKISPNKTYSGAFGSVVLSLVFAYVLLIFLGLNFNYLTFLTVILTSIYCQIGDLLFSFLKRKAKLQDTGKILPGHGGILDRIDGIIIGIPLGLITFLILS